MSNVKLPDFVTAENALDGSEAVYIAQDGKTRKTFLQKIKDFIIGTTTMGTTATDVTGAVAEIKKSVDENTTQLNAKVNKSSVINNCSATEEGFLLDARQGKYLNDKIDTIYVNKTNFNANETILDFANSCIRETNKFIVGTEKISDNPTIQGDISNQHEGLVKVLCDETSARKLVYFYDFTNGGIYYRSIFNSSWLIDWQKIA